MNLIQYGTQREWNLETAPTQMNSNNDNKRIESNRRKRNMKSTERQKTKDKRQIELTCQAPHRPRRCHPRSKNFYIHRYRSDVCTIYFFL